eukprot:scaffold5103_cov350-Prasinococcus_capsulatus_cf.AAC.5
MSLGVMKMNCMLGLSSANFISCCCAARTGRQTLSTPRSGQTLPHGAHLERDAAVDGVHEDVEFVHGPEGRVQLRAQRQHEGQRRVAALPARQGLGVRHLQVVRAALGSAIPTRAPLARGGGADGHRRARPPHSPWWPPCPQWWRSSGLACPETGLRSLR